MLHRARWVSVLLILSILFGGCLPVPEPSDAERRIFESWLQLSDFPPGWRAGRGVIEDEESIVSRARAFRASPDLEKYSVLVSHQVSVYTNVEAAIDAYLTLETAEFPTATWVSPDQMPYQSATAERFRFACIPVEISGVPAHTCRMLGQYGDMMSILYANVFEDKWFTWEDMERVLLAIDQRMAATTQ